MPFVPRRWHHWRQRRRNGVAERAQREISLSTVAATATNPTTTTTTTTTTNRQTEEARLERQRLADSRPVHKSLRNQLARYRLLRKLYPSARATTNRASPHVLDVAVSSLTVGQAREIIARERETFLRNRFDEAEVRALGVRLMRELRYSRRYAIALLKEIVRENKPTVRYDLPWRLADEYEATTDNAATRTRSRQPRVSRNSDGILSFSENEFRTLCAVVVMRLRAIAAHIEAGSARPFSRDELAERLFCYTFYMLAVTGKRLSDIASLDGRHVEQLRCRGVCVVTIRKTRKIGRIEIAEILQSLDHTQEYARGADSLARSSDRSITVNDEEHRRALTAVTRCADIRRVLTIFVQWHAQGSLRIPFDVARERARLDVWLTRTYERAFAGAKRPKGLSFHALRRVYAGFHYLHGCRVGVLQDMLDHGSRTQTNKYINRCLMELDRHDDK